MKLYTFAFAPNPRRVRWVMAEKGIEDIEIVPVDITSGQHKSADYKAKVGFAHVPALELDDGRVISESVAISRYLESLYPEPNLFGRDPAETAEIEMWTRRCELYVANPMMLHTRHTHPALAALEAPNPAVGDYMKVQGERFLKTLDRRLEGRDFIAADRLTMADIVTAIGLDFPRIIQWKPDESLANVNRWYGAMRERPGFAAGKT
jgi:glutathione S-transferase